MARHPVIVAPCSALSTDKSFECAVPSLDNGDYGVAMSRGWCDDNFEVFVQDADSLGD